MADEKKHVVPKAIKDLIPKEGAQCGPIYYGFTPQEIERTKAIAIEAFHRGQASTEKSTQEPEVPELPTCTVCGCNKITCPHCEGVKKSEREEDLERDVYEHGKTTRDALMDEAVRVAPRDAVSVDVYNITGTLLGSRMIHPPRPETAQPEPDPAAVAVEKLLRSEGWVFSSDSRWRSAVGKIVAAVRGATSGAVAVAAPPSEPAPSPTPAPWNRGL